MIAIFTQHGRTLIVGLDDNGDPIDIDGIISGPDPKIDLSKFVRLDFDPTRGIVANIATSAKPISHGVTRILK